MGDRLCKDTASACENLYFFHVTARTETPCHSIVALSVLIVYEMFTKMARQFRHGTLENFF